MEIDVNGWTWSRDNRYNVSPGPNGIDKTLTHQTTKGPAVELENLQTCFSKVKNEVQTYHE